MRRPLPDDERCTAMTTKGERCRLRRIDGREQCDVHDELWDRLVSWLYLSFSPGWIDGYDTIFDRDRAELERSLR